jgi:uncharacterized membrane protein
VVQPVPQLPMWLRLAPAAGIGLAAVLAAFLAGLLATGSPQFLPVSLAVAALFYAGKEGGIPLGISLDGSPVLVGTSLFLADVALTLILFPVVLAGMHGLERRRGFLGRILRSARRRAERHRRLVDRYGVAGLFLFLLVPFAFNGPLVGAILGRLAGISAAQSLLTILAAIGTTTLAWTSLYAYGFSELGLDPRLPILISLSIAGIVVGTSVWGAWRERHEDVAA